MLIDWNKIKEGLPKSTWALVDDLCKAHDAAPQDNVRSIDKVLREKVAVLRSRFEILKKEVPK